MFQCAPRNLTSFWVGLDGWGNKTVEQDGFAVYCAPGYSQPFYSAWWEMYPTNAAQTFGKLRLSKGDLISMSVDYYQPTDTFTLSIYNNTKHKGVRKLTPCTQLAGCSRSSAEWIAERPSHVALDPATNEYAPSSYYELTNWSGNIIFREPTAGYDQDTTPRQMTNFSIMPTAMISQADSYLAQASYPPAINSSNFVIRWVAGH